jgi:hypothetical protein
MESLFVIRFTATFLFFLLPWWGAGTVRAAEPAKATLAVLTEDLDVEKCRAFVGGKDLGPVALDTLTALLGLAKSDKPSEWSTGLQSDELRYFRIALKKPITLGSICTLAPNVSILRDPADYPGDVTNDKQWQALEHGPVHPLDRVTPVRAVRFTYKINNLPWDTTLHASTCDAALLLSGRFWSPEVRGGQGRSKLKPPPETNSKSKAKPEGLEQSIGYWPDGRTLAGLAWLQPQAGNVTYSYLPPEVTTHPRLAEEAEWKALAIASSASGPRLLSIETPVAAQAIRVAGKLPPANQGASRFCLLSLVALSEGETPLKSFIPPAPVTFEYHLPQSGFIATRLSNAQGNHVRRLIAEVPREQGTVREAWDLTDDQGQTVSPGDYKLFGIVRPPLKLTYELTAYNPGKPAWNAPVPGGGGWMADHSPPVACCAVGDRLFFSAAGAEFGYGLIATDLEGTKVWSDHPGALRLVSDGRCAYIVNDDQVTRIDPQRSFAHQQLFKFKYDEQKPGHSTGYIHSDRSGAAAKLGMLCVSYCNSPEAWVRSAFNPADVDLKWFAPPVYPKKVHVTALTPAEEIFSAFQAMTSSINGKFGDAETKGALANTLVLPFNKEVPLGTILVPSGTTDVWALRPGKTLPKAFQPPDPTLDRTAASAPNSLVDDLLSDSESRFDPKTWVRLKTTGQERPELALPAEGLATRAVVFTGPELRRLDYGLLLDRRYRDAASRAKFIVNEGAMLKNGRWRFQRPSTRPISFSDPVTATLVWDQPTSLRGCVVLRPLEWSGLAIDVWTGPTDQPLTEQALADDTQWREVHQHRQNRNHIKFSWHTNRVVTADFGEVVSTRALRLRYVEPPQGAGAQQKAIIDGGFEAIVALEPAGNDVAHAISLAQRVTVLGLPDADGKEARELGHVPLAGAGALAFDPAGELYAACDQGIVRFRKFAPNSISPPEIEVVIPAAAAGKPRALLFHPDGRLFALDGQTKLVKAFDIKTGRELLSFGGAPKSLGKWDPTKLIEPTAMAFDSAGKLWIVETSFQPKRISRWSADGQFEKEILGPTHYGGGGMMDPRDRTVVNHLGMKFRLDYKNRTSVLESRLAQYGGGYYLPDRVAYVGEHRYLIGDRSVVTPFGDAGPTSVICREVDGVAVPVVAAGVLGDWKELARNKALRDKSRDFNALKTGFAWVDANRDTQVQADEVLLIPQREVTRSPYIGDDLSLNYPARDISCRLRIKSREGDGTPRYDLSAVEDLPDLTNQAMITGKGETLVMGHKLLAAGGAKLWTYPDRYMGVQASYQTPWGFYDRPPGVLAGGFGMIGHFEIAGETLFCVGGNNGDYYAFTRDGLLAASIVGGPSGYGRRFFSIPEYRPGETDLSDLRKTVEDFHGHVTRAEDGNVYAIAGKNHVTVMRVDGLEKLQRFEGKCTVTAEDVERTRHWLQEKARIEQFLSREGPKVLTVASLPKPPSIDGDIVADWPNVESVTIKELFGPDGKETAHWKAKLAFDSEYLYLAGSSADHSPLINRAEDLKTLFQKGDSLDLHLGLDPQADPARSEAAVGDLRLVFSVVNDEPVCMLYRFKGDKQSAVEPTVFRSPVGEITIDEVRPLREAKVAFNRLPRYWTIEAAIPWSALGYKAPTKSLSLRGDVGVTESDPQGISTVARYYWANRTQVVLSDLPGEARVQPSLWGEFRFEVRDGVDALLEAK